jgi:hypothetical protein
VIGGMSWPWLALAAVAAGALGALAWSARQLLELRGRVELLTRQQRAALGEAAQRLERLERLSKAQGWSERAARNARVLEALVQVRSWADRLRARPAAGEPAAGLDVGVEKAR